VADIDLHRGEQPPPPGQCLDHLEQLALSLLAPPGVVVPYPKRYADPQFAGLLGVGVGRSQHNAAHSASSASSGEGEAPTQSSRFGCNSRSPMRRNASVSSSTQARSAIPATA
jgi:hypothetical protein